MKVHDASSSPDLSVRHYGASRGSHAHDHFQILLGLDGVLELEVEGRGQRIGAGDGRLMRPGERHDYFASQGGSRCLVLDTTRPLWERCADAPRSTPQLLSLARYLALCLAQPAPSTALFHAPTLLLEAWGPPTPGTRCRAIDWASLSAWAEARWHRPLSVAELAAEVFLSPSQFAQRCRDEQGMSAMHWLRLQRLRHARQLRSSGFSVAESARRTGYRSPSALTAALRRLRAPR